MNDTDKPEVCATCNKPIIGDAQKYQFSYFCSKRCKLDYYYRKGNCLEFALALHQKYAYPLGAIYSCDSKRTLVHAFCINPCDKNLVIDSRGVVSVRDLMLDYPDYCKDDIISITEEDLKAEFLRDAKYLSKNYEEMVKKAINCIEMYPQYFKI